jgi:hypothetical protein
MGQDARLTGVYPIATIPALVLARFLRPEVEKANVNTEIRGAFRIRGKWRNRGGAGTSFDPRRFY